MSTCASMVTCVFVPIPSVQYSVFVTIWQSLSISISHEHGFYYFHTPLITGSDAEGAGNMFQVTTLDLDRVAKGGEVDYSADFFGKRTNLTVSGQLEGELGATALGAIYTFGPTFRAENSNTPRHLAEFWMVEPEVAFIDKDELMDLEGRLHQVLCSLGFGAL